MAVIAVYTSGFLKRGDPITNASFEQVFYDGQWKKERYEPISTTGGGGDYSNSYEVYLLAQAAYADVRVSAPNHKPKKVHVTSIGSYEVWLDH